MLRSRLLTAAFLIPLVIAGVLLLPDAAFAAVLGLFLAAAFLEWARLMGKPGLLARWVFVCAMLASLVLIWVFHAHFWLVVSIELLAVVWWVACFFWLGFYPFGNMGSQCWRSLLRGFLGVLVLLPAFPALIVLRETGAHGPAWLLFLLLMIWAADTGAYFSGKTWGKHALLRRVSPGKTLEGAVGGLLSGLILPLIVGLGVMNLDALTLLYFVLLCLGVVAVSMVGDLTISAMKRLAGVKDSGRLFPGHGGVLDRMDSLFAAAPCFALGMLALGLQ